jgi:hypothetical protein
MTGFWAILSIVFAELTFLLSYLLAYLILKTIFVIFSILFRSQFLPSIQPGFLGFTAGTVGSYLAFLLLMTFKLHYDIDTNWYIILSIVIIFYGQVQYLSQYLTSQTDGRLNPVGWPGRLNAIISAPIHRGQFQYYKTIISNAYPEKVSNKKILLGRKLIIGLKNIF